MPGLAEPPRSWDEVLRRFDEAASAVEEILSVSSPEDLPETLVVPDVPLPEDLRLGPLPAGLRARAEAVAAHQAAVRDRLATLIEERRRQSRAVTRLREDTSPGPKPSLYVDRKV